MPEHTELVIKDIIVHIFEDIWNGHWGMKLYRDRFVCFIDKSQADYYKILANERCSK
jgi:hypothetical protein